jgi:hypothetical protein
MIPAKTAIQKFLVLKVRLPARAEINVNATPFSSLPSPL